MAEKIYEIIKEKPYKDRYMDSLSRVRKNIPAISKSLKCSSMEYKLIRRGMRSGMLDTDKIAEAFQGVPTVYMREGQVKISLKHVTKYVRNFHIWENSIIIAKH